MYDVIVVGARCGGSPTAMLLARKGYNVLLVDRMTFPSDIMSTHFIHVPGVARLDRWGVLETLKATNCPPIETLDFRMEGAAFTPPARPDDQPQPYPGYCPRRHILDQILVDAAVASGAEFRENFAVKELMFDGDSVTGIQGGERGDGANVAEEARIVIGADGMHSTVAKAVKAPEYNTRPSMSFAYYAYWSGVDLPNAELHFMEDGGILAFPTHDGNAVVAAGGPDALFHEFREDIEGNYMRVLDRTGDLSKRVRAGKRVERFIGTNDQPNFFRKPYGPGWALVGDAGYHRDFVTGLGITDAFRDAEYLAEAIDQGFGGTRRLDEAMEEYESKRNAIAAPLYDLTVQMVSGEPPSLEQFIAFGVAMMSMMPESKASPT
jgi:flavin-dependent dehydrogenase